MIFRRGNFWSLPNDTRKYVTFEEAQVAYNKILAKQERERLAKEEEIRKALENLDSDSSPFEIMIQKNICKLCNWEPCECSTFSQKTDLGELEV